MKWITVKDRLPEEWTFVLAYNEKLMLTRGFAIQYWVEFTDQNAKWFKKNFSHWMPLPKPPKK